MFRARRKSGRKGAVALEYAIVLIPFLITVLGILDFGFLVMAKHQITNAARECGRLACVNTDVHDDADNKTTAEIEIDIRRVLSPVVRNAEVEITNMDDANPLIDAPWTSSATFQHRIRVEVRGEYVSFFPLFSLLHSGTMEPIPLAAISVIRSEGH